MGYQMIEIIIGLASAVSVYSFFIFYKLKKVSDENKAFVDSLNNLSMREHYLKEENEKLLKDIERLNNQLKNSADASVLNKNQDLAEQYKLVEKERDLLKNELGLIKKDVDEFNRLFLEIKTEMKNMIKEREEIYKELKNLQIKLNNAIKEKKNAENELDRYRDNIQEELIRIYAKVDSIMNKVEDELKRLADENKSLKRRIEEILKEDSKEQIIDDKDKNDILNTSIMSEQESLVGDFHETAEFYNSIDQSLITELSRLLKQKNE